MENLLPNLQRTIKALETLSAKELPQAEQIDELLDQLFQQKIDLANLPTSTSAPAFQPAAQALSHAAGRAERAAKDKAHVQEMIVAVTDAIGKVAKLLNSVVS